MRQRLWNFAQRYLIADTPQMMPKVRWQSAFGAFVGLLFTGGAIVVAREFHLWILAPMGATAFMLFALPHSPLAQPWSVLGGYLVALTCGLIASALVPEPAVAGALAVGMTVLGMSWLACMHPPGAAFVMAIVAEGRPTLPRSLLLLETTLVDMALLLALAWVINNHLFGRRYPQCRADPDDSHHTRDAAPLERTGLQHADLQAAIQEEDSFVDVQEADLLRIYERAMRHAVERHMQVFCGDIMARDVVSVEFGTPLNDAWKLLRHHQVKALPVVDSFRRVIGLITADDYFRQLNGESTSSSLLARFQELLQPTPGMASEKPEVVGQIMSRHIQTTTENTPIAALLARVADEGMHHVPVTDEEKRLVGMITQSDLNAALYRMVARLEPAA